MCLKFKGSWQHGASWGPSRDSLLFTGCLQPTYEIIDQPKFPDEPPKQDRARAPPLNQGSQTEACEGRQLLDIIKGSGAPSGDGGFISSFHMRPPALFPRSLPSGVPDSALTPNLRRLLIRKVPLVGESLQRYQDKRALGLPGKRLQRYCNLCVHFGALHSGKHGSKARVLQNMATCAPKLHAVAQDISNDAAKAQEFSCTDSSLFWDYHIIRLGNFSTI